MDWYRFLLIGMNILQPDIRFSQTELDIKYLPPGPLNRLRPVTKPAEKPQVLAAARIMLTRISRSLVNKRQSLNGHRQSRTGFWIEVAW